MLPEADDAAAAFLEPASFDRDWGLEELLGGVDRAALARHLATLLGGPVRLTAVDGKVVVGDAAAALSCRIPVRHEIETIGYLETAGDAGAAGQAALALITLLLKASARYLMASSLHLEAVRSDYEELQRRHRALEASEARYRELSQQLEQRVAQQVAALEGAQRRLYQTEKLASVGRLAAGVAHEINNPLGFICSNLATAQSYLAALSDFGGRLRAAADPRRDWHDHDLDGLLQDFGALLAESAGGAERMAAIVRDLKGFSNVDGGAEETVDINECLRTVCNLARAQIRPDAVLSVDPQPLPPVRCRPGQLSQVFWNLLLNAGQAIAAGGEIAVTTALEGDRVRVQIRDNGAGISEEHLARVFDPFFTTRGVGQGVGLGLTVCHDIVTAHGGEIAVSSRAGAGTTVTVRLPSAP